MLLQYKIKISTEKIQELNNILEVTASHTRYGWELCLDGNSFSFSKAVDYFTSLIEGRWSSMSNIGIKSEDITFWIYYEYDQQCNLEFDTKEVKKIARLGVTLCISCWETGSEIVLG